MSSGYENIEWRSMAKNFITKNCIICSVDHIISSDNFIQKYFIFDINKF